MDRFIEMLAAQNPGYKLYCRNEDCGKGTPVDTLTFLSSPNGRYEHTCPHCNHVSIFTDIDKEIERTKIQFRKIGLSW